MYIRVTESGSVFPYTIRMLKRDNAKISFPKDISNETLAEYGVYPVIESEKPDFNTATHFIDASEPRFNGGVWVIEWDIKPIVKTPEQIKQEITDATSQRLDNFARTRNYDSILSACTYATSQIPQFAKEGQYCVNMRDATWTKLYDIMQEVTIGIRVMPTGYADIESELPVLDWSNV